MKRTTFYCDICGEKCHSGLKKVHKLSSSRGVDVHISVEAIIAQETEITGRPISDICEKCLTEVFMDGGRALS